MNLFQATTECPHCPRKFHQIDDSEERALTIVRGALAHHVVTDHAEVAAR